MKISPPSREIYKESIKTLIRANPRLNNIKIAESTGLHRNTVSKMLNEINIENQERIRKSWNKNLRVLFKKADELNERMHNLWYESYPTQVNRKPTQLVSITELQWKITKESYKEVLRFIGVTDPKALIQINFSTPPSQHK